MTKPHICRHVNCMNERAANANYCATHRGEYLDAQAQPKDNVTITVSRALLSEVLDAAHNDLSDKLNQNDDYSEYDRTMMSVRCKQIAEAFGPLFPGETERWNSTAAVLAGEEDEDEDDDDSGVCAAGICTKATEPGSEYCLAHENEEENTQ